MKIETKYDIGDTVYYLNIEPKKIKEYIVTGLSYYEHQESCDPPKLYYYLKEQGKDKCSGWLYKEKYLFPTKEELIKSL